MCPLTCEYSLAGDNHNVYIKYPAMPTCVYCNASSRSFVYFVVRVIERMFAHMFLCCAPVYKGIERGVKQPPPGLYKAMISTAPLPLNRSQYIAHAQAMVRGEMCYRVNCTEVYIYIYVLPRTYEKKMVGEKIVGDCETRVVKYDML